MGLSVDGDDRLDDRYDELCLDLNMDKKTKEDAWRNYEKIKKNYTLEVRNFRKFGHISTVRFDILRAFVVLHAIAMNRSHINEVTCLIFREISSTGLHAPFMRLVGEQLSRP